MFFPLFVGALYLSLFCYAFKFCNHLAEEERAGCSAIIVLQMYCYYKCSVALPRGTVGRSAVCDYGGISLSYSLTLQEGKSFNLSQHCLHVSFCQKH